MKRFALLLGLAALLIAGCGGSGQSDSDSDVVLTEEQAQLVNTYAEEMDYARAKVDEALSAIEQGDGVAALEAFWVSAPDELLLDAAAGNDFNIQAQVERLLADPVDRPAARRRDVGAVPVRRKRDRPRVRSGRDARRMTSDQIWHYAKIDRVANVIRPYLESLA